MAERIVLSGPEAVVRPLITQVMAIHTLIRNRDVGCWVGNQVEELTRAAPQSLKVIIIFHHHKYPPFRRCKDTRQVRTEVKIPHLNPAFANWNTIKAACGGASGYNWGSWLATAKLALPDSENLKFMKLYGGTKSGAIARLEALASLSQCQILKLSATDEGISGSQVNNKSLKKISTDVYPSYFTILNQKKVQADAKGYGTLTGTYSRDEARINLWPDTEPTDAADIIRECLRTPSVPGNG